MPKIMAWGSDHWVGHLANLSYTLLVPVLYITIGLLAFTGKAKRAQEFHLMANLLAFVMGIILFALLPAVGPWYGYHFTANPALAQCQADLLRLRQPGPYVHHQIGVICFPSGHVLGAVFVAYALWVFRPLRIPASVFSGLLILSAHDYLSWHYFVDVLGGIFVAVAAIVSARWLCQDQPQYVPEPSYSAGRRLTNEESLVAMRD